MAMPAVRFAPSAGTPSTTALGSLRFQGRPSWRILWRRQFRGKLRPFCLDHVAHLIADRSDTRQPLELGADVCRSRSVRSRSRYAETQEDGSARHSRKGAPVGGGATDRRPAPT
jgi:hypothetical protein